MSASAPHILIDLSSDEDGNSVSTASRRTRSPGDGDGGPPLKRRPQPPQPPNSLLADLARSRQHRNQAREARTASLDRPAPNPPPSLFQNPQSEEPPEGVDLAVWAALPEAIQLEIRAQYSASRRPGSPSPNPSTSTATTPTPGSGCTDSTGTGNALANAHAPGRQPDRDDKANGCGSIRLTLLTWNIWFDQLKQPERMGALGLCVAQNDPDVLALQELTSDLMALLRTQRWWRDYQVVAQEGMHQSPYFVALLVKRGTLTVTNELQLPFQNSCMGRALVGAKAKVNGTRESIVFTTAHLESPVGPWAGEGGRIDLYSPHRKAQLESTLETLDRASAAVLMGDLNWSDPTKAKVWDGDMGALMPAGWVDSWRLRHPDEMGCTYDGRKNPMLTNRLSKRLDRCLVKNLVPVEAHLVGTEPIDGVTYRKRRTRNKGAETYEEVLPVLPSDHFGLCVVVELQEGSAAKKR